MRPRFVERGKKIKQSSVKVRVVASMRPRFVERGKRAGWIAV